MLALFNAFCLPKSKNKNKNKDTQRVQPLVYISTPKNENACFDLMYRSSGNINYTMTHNNEGVFVAYKVHNDDGTTSPLQFVTHKNGQHSTYEDIDITFSHHKNDDKTWLEFITLNVTNNGYFPKKIDLGLSADVDFGKIGDSDDDAPLTLLGDGRGFMASNTALRLYYSVFTFGNVEYPDVDTLFLGNMSDAETNDASKFPYFQNQTAKSTTGDSVWAFSWLNREILPGDYELFGVVMRHYKGFPTPPRIFDLTEKKKYYNPNEKVTIKYQVIDMEDNEDVTVYTIFNNQNTSETQLESSKIHTTEINVGEGPIFEYEIYAVDTKQFVSNSISDTFVVGPPPTIEVPTEPKKSYEVGQKITAKVTVTTSRTYEVYYQFDNGRIEKASSTTDLSIDIPYPVKPGKKHKLTIFAQDQYGLESNMKVFEFEYTGELKEPEKKSGDKSGDKTGDKSDEDPLKEGEPNKKEGIGKTVGIVVGVIVGLIIVGAIIAAVAYFVIKGKKDAGDRGDALNEENATEAGVNA